MTFKMAEPCGQAYEKSPQSDRGNREERVSRAIVAALIAALGPVSFGYCIGYSSSALEDLQNADNSSVVRLSADQGSWFSVSWFVFFYKSAEKKELVKRNSPGFSKFEPAPCAIMTTRQNCTG